MNGINVYGILQRRGETCWRMAQYMAQDGRWYACTFFKTEHAYLSSALMQASVRGYRNDTPYLKELHGEREIRLEEVAELLGPLEALACIQEDI